MKMKIKNKLKRLVLLSTAAVTACIGILGASGAAFERDNSPKVKIIVTVTGGRKNRLKAESKIKEIYPQFKTDFEYDTLINGFACTVTENTYKKIKFIPNVASAEKTTKFVKSDDISAQNETTAEEDTGIDRYKGEGQAVAVLDTELNIRHEMFKPLKEQNLKLDKNFITDLTDSKTLNAKADGRAYVSTKIPFAYSYTNKSNPYELSLKHSGGSHGTHVCGICVGEKTSKAEGAAPMAQLVFMGVFEYNEDIQQYITDDAMVIAALEDASKLNVDAVNLSFGSDTEATESSAYSTACQTLINNGTAIFSAAGNNSNKTDTSVKNPDHSTIMSPSDINGVMSVASCKKSGMSSFSCEGVSQNLELKPDITAIGENIVSAFADGGYRSSSGTSMAAPMAMGTYLKLKARLKETLPQLSDVELMRTAQNIMMNSAVPFKDKNGLTISPRSQGAGQINTQNINNCNALLTDRNGQSKLSLYDKLTDTLTLPVTIQNLGDEDIFFNQAELSVTTDGSKYSEKLNKEVFSGTQALKFECDISELKSIGAGQSKNADIQIYLDKTQLNKLSKTFPNGFFIEGYIMLSNADNCCDISIPFMGFYGDWGKLPIFPSEITDTNDLYPAFQPVTEIKGEPEQANANSVSGNSTKAIYISPNGDGLADNIGMAITNVREIVDRQIVIKNSKGNVVCTLNYDIPMQRYDINNILLANDLDLKNNEEYTFTLSAGINYPNAPKQSVGCKFKVDNTSPKFESLKVAVKNGRKILTVKVKDNNRVDGICIFGQIKGKNHRYTPKDDCNISRLSSLLYPKMKQQSANFFDIKSNNAQSKSFTVSYDITNLTNVNIYAVDGAVNIVKGNMKTASAKNEPTADNSSDQPVGSNGKDNKQGIDKVPAESGKTDDSKPEGSKRSSDKVQNDNPSTGGNEKFCLSCIVGLLAAFMLKRKK